MPVMVHEALLAYMSSNLAKSTGTVGVMTLMSRILGFIRDMLCAVYFGASAGYDALLIAFKIPNFMRSLFAEGAFSQAFVPLLSEQQTKGDAVTTKSFVDRVAGCLASVLLLVTVLGVVAAPVIILLFAPGFADDASRFEMSVSMLRITFPYIMLISLTAMCGGILNTFGSYAPPAITPCLLNLSMIFAVLVISPYFVQPVYALAWGILFGGLIQLLFQLPFLARIKMLPRMRPSFFDPQVMKLLRLMVPALFGVSVVQINLLLGTVFASFLPEGSISWLYYADRLMQFPLGVFGVALATVILPNLARAYARASEQAYSKTLDWSLRVILLIGLPAGLGLIVCSGPLIVTLFNYHAFAEIDVLQTRPALVAYALGLVAFIFIKILASACYARQDIRTPVKAASCALVLNAIMCLLFIGPFKHYGLALATSLSAFVNAGVLFWSLIRRSIISFQAGWLAFAGRCLLANCVMVMVVVLISGNLKQWLVASWQWRLMHLAGIILVAVVSYCCSLWVSGVRLAHVRPPAPTK